MNKLQEKETALLWAIDWLSYYDCGDEQEEREKKVALEVLNEMYESICFQKACARAKKQYAELHGIKLSEVKINKKLAKEIWKAQK